MESARTRARVTTTVIYILLVIMAVIMLVPFVWMILTALKTNQEAISVSPFYIFPHNGWHWETFGEVWKSYNFVLLYKNTLLMIFFRVVFACLTATMAGYAFGRLNFPGKKFLFSLVLIQMMIPSTIFIIPQYLMVSKLGWLNTCAGLVFPGMVTAFGTYLLKTGYQGLPKDLEEAAGIDGCNIGQRFLRIMMPLTKAALVSLMVLSIVSCWNEYLSPLIFLVNTKLYTVSQTIRWYMLDDLQRYELVMATATSAIVPILILFIACQKSFVEGIATSGVKG